MAAAGLLAGGLAYRLFFWFVPLGLVFASVLSFWVDADRVAAQDAARHFGISAAATQSAMSAIAEEHHARWYFLLAGLVLLVWFGIGVVRALNVAHSVAWSLRPEKLRRPLIAGLAFSGIVTTLIVVSASTQYLREQYGGTGLWLTVSLFVFYLVAVLWIMDKLPHRSASWRDLLPGAVLVAFGTEVIHIVVVLYLVPKLGHSSELYGALGTATVILLWLYLLARLVVAAAFLNAALWDRRIRAALIPSGREDRRPVVLDADHRPALCLRPLQRVFRAGDVVELPVCIVVEDEQAEERLVGVLREVEHRNVAVRVAGGKERSAADTAPDPDRLLRAVVEDVGLRLAHDRAASVVARVVERGRAADDPVARDAVHLVADRSHEVAAAARGDVVREPVRLQVPQQLDHRRVRTLEVGRGRASDAGRYAGTSAPAPRSRRR